MVPMMRARRDRGCQVRPRAPSAGVGHDSAMRLPFRGRPAAAADPVPADPPRPADPDAPQVEPVLVYGGAWCIDCHVVTRWLDREQVPYRWIDLGKDAAAQERITALGYRAIPVVMLPDGQTLVEPSTRELAAALGMGRA